MWVLVLVCQLSCGVSLDRKIRGERFGGFEKTYKFSCKCELDTDTVKIDGTLGDRSVSEKKYWLFVCVSLVKNTLCINFVCSLAGLKLV